MYSTEDEQEPAVKKLQKESKISKYSSTKDKQGPTVKNPQKTSKVPDDEDSQETLPAKIPKFADASYAYILTKGVRKGKQSRFRASEETDKFCHHHKQT